MKRSKEVRDLCLRHNRRLSYSEFLAQTCSWCNPGRFAELAKGSTQLLESVAVRDNVLGLKLMEDDDG